MKVVSIVGARPQFVKAGAVSREIREVAAEVAIREAATNNKGPLASQLLWPLLGLLLSALILGGLLVLEPGRALLRTLLGN